MEELDSLENPNFMNHESPTWYRLNDSIEFSTDIMPVLGGWVIRTSYDNHGEGKSGVSTVFIPDLNHDWDFPVTAQT
jgi:hypothetical protein